MSEPTPTAPESTRYAAALAVVEGRQAAMVEGCLLDLFTASAMVAVFETLSPGNRAKFDGIPLEKLAAFCLEKVSGR